MIFKIFILVVFLGAVYSMYKNPGNIRHMLRMILTVILAIILFSPFRSPQYIVWFTPFAALMIADDIWGIFLFVAVQILSFVEYPLAYGVLYLNQVYLSNWALLFFTLYFLIHGLLLWRAFIPRTPISEKEIVNE